MFFVSTIEHRLLKWNFYHIFWLGTEWCHDKSFKSNLILTTCYTKSEEELELVNGVTQSQMDQLLNVVLLASCR